MTSDMVIETLEDVSEYACRPPGATLHIEDISYSMSRIKDFPTYLHLRLLVDVQSAQRQLWEFNTTDTILHLQTQIAKATWLLQQLELPKSRRDPLAQIEIDGHQHYYKRQMGR